MHALSFGRLPEGAKPGEEMVIELPAQTLAEGEKKADETEAKKEGGEVRDSLAQIQAPQQLPVGSHDIESCQLRTLATC